MEGGGSHKIKVIESFSVVAKNDFFVFLLLIKRNGELRPPQTIVLFIGHTDHLTINLGLLQ